MPSLRLRRDAAERGLRRWRCLVAGSELLLYLLILVFMLQVVQKINNRWTTDEQLLAVQGSARSSSRFTLDH